MMPGSLAANLDLGAAIQQHLSLRSGADRRVRPGA
jgi:hypothetical protein